MERPTEELTEQEGNCQKTIDVYPFGKGKRILLFLGDFFICFIFAIFLSNVLVFPIGKAIADFDSRERDFVQSSQDRYAILYDNKLLYNDSADNKNNFEENAQYTYRLYLKNYLDGSHPEYEVFHNYYSNYANRNGLSLLEIYEKYDRAGLFDLNLESEPKIELTDEASRMFAPLLDSKDEMGKEGQSLYDRGFTETFIPIYNLMLDDIKANDLRSPLEAPSRSYNQLTADIEEFEEFEKNLAIICSIIAFALACATTYFAYPLINKRGRTITQSIMKADRVDKRSLRLLARPFRVIFGLYQAILTLPCLLFVPIPTIDVASVFSIPQLTGVSFAALILVIASALVIVFDKFNRGLSEIFTASIVIKEEMLDEVYRAKGYYL